uniref:G-protein coupled receptors family 1 profile domain-containing protein n=1 Tax=Romanomermis culicivorax TaxID=13658 RepID=A0A915ILR9_ROMCU
MRRSTTIKMLIAKACVNMTFILFLSPLSVMLINNGRQNTWVDEPKLWSMWPFLLFSTNTSGTCAAWLTVMMTFERYLLVAHPVKGKQLSNNKNVYLGMLIILIVAIFLHLEIPIVREVESIYCPKMGKYFHREYIRKGDVYRLWDTFYYWSQVVVQMLIPDMLMLIFTASITYQLLYQTLPNYFSERKQCVTRMTMATTACHLVLELPAVLVYAVAAIYGPSFINHNRTMCLCHALSNFGNQLNASICFLIYASCSSKYRSLLRTRCRSTICCLFPASETPPPDPINNGLENGHRRRTRSHENGGRSLIDESSSILTLNGDSPASETKRATSLVNENGRVKRFLTPPTANNNGQSKKKRSRQNILWTNHEETSCKVSETTALTKL